MEPHGVHAPAVETSPVASQHTIMTTSTARIPSTAKEDAMGCAMYVGNKEEQDNSLHID
jgi:hypothetical protein